MNAGAIPSCQGFAGTGGASYATRSEAGTGSGGTSVIAADSVWSRRRGAILTRA